ncbi:MAG: MAPEG family protein [Rhodobacter sp.]|nr:MAPEG family protein [Rhodobacter sp.]
MTAELTYLLLTALLAGVLWIPSVLGQVQSRGTLKPDDYVTLPTSPLADWATRANRAHLNMVENFSIFAAVVLVAHVLGIHTGLTAACAAIFFWARLAHALVFIAGIKQLMLRTVIFTVAWAAWLVLALEVLRKGLPAA